MSCCFGDGAVEDALDGGPGVSDGEGRFVCIFHEVAGELLGVISRAAPCSLGHVTWAGAGCGNKGWAGGERGDNGNIKGRGGTFWIKDKIHARMFEHDTRDEMR